MAGTTAATKPNVRMPTTTLKTSEPTSEETAGKESETAMGESEASTEDEPVAADPLAVAAE